MTSRQRMPSAPNSPPASTRPVRIVLVEACPTVRYLVGEVLELDDRFEVVGEAATARRATAVVAWSSPDLVLADLSVGGNGGLSLIRQLRQSDPGLIIVAFADRDDDASLTARSVVAGADGLVEKCDFVRLVDRLGDLVSMRLLTGSAA